MSRSGVLWVVHRLALLASVGMVGSILSYIWAGDVRWAYTFWLALGVSVVAGFWSLIELCNESTEESPW